MQESFISKVSDESYQRFTSELDGYLGTTIQYRVCEMPIFVSHQFPRKLEDAAIDLVQQCVTPEMLGHTEIFLADSIRVANEQKHPIFSVVDFAVVQGEDGNFDIQLIELQGFPSLFGYQYAFASKMQEFYQIPSMTPFLSNIDYDAYIQLLSSSIYGNHDPAECVLMEVDPDQQKTLPDFLAMKKMIGLNTVNIRDVRKVGKHLVVPVDGKTITIKRIFNRSIVDELDDLGVQPDFSWNDDLDVEWAGHPNWYFRMSKAVIPWLRHASVPSTRFLDELVEIPQDLDSYVLKPLFAFAGKGVELHPTIDHIRSIPEHERHQWVLQRKVTYAPCVATPHGLNKVELRVMLIWPEGSSAPVPAMSLARTGRGELMGARYNTIPWTGSSGCLFE